MVATRRAAQPAVEDELAMDNPELALKKKPIRKTTAKTTKAAANSAPKPKATRGKKAEPDLEEEMEDVHPVKPTRSVAGRRKKQAVPERVVEDEEIPVRPTRPTKAGSVRGKKAAAIAEDAITAPTIEVPKPTRGTKTGSVRGRKAAIAIDEEPVPAAEEPKTTRTTKTGSVRGRKATVAVESVPALLPPPEEIKATRSSRTTAAKAPPLSPKKITQVSKPATRTTRNANQKPAAKAAHAKVPPKARAPTRKRTESNENADPDADEVIDVTSTTPVKMRTPRVPVKKAERVAESDASMSSRPTTPNDSNAQSFSQNDDLDELQIDDESTPAGRAVAEPVSDTSDDELCGPKTPMKRSSPGATARYRDSVQRTIRKYKENMNMETPARRFAVLGSQRGTPQTQKPYCKPVPPGSDVRPMTVSRGADRAFVFRDIRAGVPSMRQYESLDEDQDELSFIPDEDIIPMDNDVADEPTPVPVESVHSDSNGESDVEMEDEPEFTPNIAFQEDEDAYIAPSLIEPDPEETVLIHDVESRTASPSMDAVESFETEDTVLIHRSDMDDHDDDNNGDYGSDSGDDSVINYGHGPFEAFASKGTPIAVDFDEHLADVRASPQKAHSEGVVTQNTTAFELQDEVDATAGAEMEVEFAEFVPELQSRRQTVNLDEFIEMSALSEPTVGLHDFAEQNDANAIDVMEVDDLVEDVAASKSQEVSPEMEPEMSALMNPEPDSLKADAPAPAVMESEHAAVPHYALPTMAFDARRKSLPVLSLRTPIKTGVRPNTSDGTSMPRIINPFANAWWSRQSGVSLVTTPIKDRPSTAHGIVSRSHAATPAKSSKTTTPVVTPGERFPRLAPRSNYEEHAKTTAPHARFQSPLKQSPKRRETFHKAMPGHVNLKPVAVTSSPVRTPVATPQTTPGERYPRLRPRQGYEEHAKTVAAPVRFKTPPAKTPLKRPATTQKPDSLRRAALTGTMSHTPMKTPLKGPAVTPSQVPMTPHPAAPLRGIVAMVEVYTLEGASASAPFLALLHRLGAKTTRSLSDKVTHVVFKDGSPTTLQRIRLNNKQVDKTGKGPYIHCVNSRWVTDCEAEGMRKDESEEEYIVDVAEVPRGGKRRRKSMEPSALMNIGGNIVRDRKSSLGRASIGRVSSLGRSPLKVDSPAKQPESAVLETPKVDVGEKENSGDDQSSPVTPAWIAAPGQLVQQTAPIHRIRKLEIQGGKEPKNRRLTFWHGGA